MKSVDRLVAEHDIIERGLDVLEKAVARIESGQPIPDDFPKWAPEFFRSVRRQVPPRQGRGLVLSAAQGAWHSILTRTLFNDDDVKVVIFGFGQGEELSEHTASMPAILHFISGEATFTLGDETVEAQPGTWIHMAPKLKHSVKTKTPVVMFLLLLKK